jgi:hypothetical protein
MFKIACALLGLYCPTLADHALEIEKAKNNAAWACASIKMMPTLPTYCEDDHGHFWSESGIVCHPRKAERLYPVCACVKGDEMSASPRPCDRFDWDESMTQ